jgi:hypothetical protein
LAPSSRSEASGGDFRVGEYHTQLASKPPCGGGG